LFAGYVGECGTCENWIGKLINPLEKGTSARVT